MPQLWQGRSSKAVDSRVNDFNSSIRFDARMIEQDIHGSMVHSAMLGKQGIISQQDVDDIHKGLQSILNDLHSGALEIDPNAEDVHTFVEQTLTARVGDAGKRLHTGRSRNDQVATDMRLFFKFACEQMGKKIGVAIKSLLKLASDNKSILIPGYTHLQRAQPVSVAHHILAWVEMLARDVERFNFCAEGANVSPLGSGAIAGTTLPIDRLYAASQLGFVDPGTGDPIVTGNSMDAVADRDIFLEFAFNCAVFGTHLSRISEDVIIWNTSEFAFVKLPDEFTTGSSLMPQKKNPDAFELMRGKAARLAGNLTALMTLVKGLPLTYNRDLQEDKPPIFDSYEQASICAEVLGECAKGIKFNAKKCAEAVSDPMLLATDLADYFVMKGVPFREAHHIVGRLVALSEKSGVPINELSDAEVFAHCDKADSSWRDVFDLKRAMSMREKIGMPGPKQIDAQLEAWNKIFQ